MSKQPTKQPGPEDATRLDHHQLTFWLWAVLRNGYSYLKISSASEVAMEEMPSIDATTMKIRSDNADALCREEQLAAYNFVTAIGVLIRVLKRSQHLFPTIQPHFDAAKHLQKEGKNLRDMVEHAYGDGGYLAGGGHHPDQFVRENPSHPRIAADAISTLILDDGHWLGGRLCVEKVIDEVAKIHQEAQKISPPKSARR